MIRKVVRDVGKRIVVSTRVQVPHECGERNPCSGHGDLILSFTDGTSLQVPATSVEIGVLQKHFLPDEETHFSCYSRGYEEWAAKNN